MIALSFKKIGLSGLLPAVLVSVGVLTSSPVSAQPREYPVDVSLMGGAQGILDNESAIQDNFVNIPVALAVAYQATPILAVEGEFAWLIPIENSVDIGIGGEQDLKNPDILTYQANLRASLPITSSAIEPYATAGLGAMTFMSTTDENRYPQLENSETVFAINFGLGANFPLIERLSLRADFLEFVGFPSDDAEGLSNGGNADPVWMPRGTLGLRYHF